MGGNWTPNPLPIRPGAYINFESSGSSPVEPGEFGRVGMPVRSTWGPANQFVDIVTDADRTSTYGPVDGDPTSTTETSWLIREAILGKAELVKAYRVVGVGATAATVTINDDLALPTLQLDAKFVGTRANGFEAIVRQNSLFSTKADLVIREGTVELEVWTHTKDDVASVVTAINNSLTGSVLVDATLLATPDTNEVVDLSSTITPPTSGNFRLTVDYGSGGA